MRERIEVKIKNIQSIRSRVVYGSYFATESVISPGVMYVLDPDEIAVIITHAAIRLPMSFAEEIAALVADIKDNEARGIMRRSR